MSKRSGLLYGALLAITVLLFACGEAAEKVPGLGGKDGEGGDSGGQMVELFHLDGTLNLPNDILPGATLADLPEALSFRLLDADNRVVASLSAVRGDLAFTGIFQPVDRTVAWLPDESDEAPAKPDCFAKDWSASGDRGWCVQINQAKLNLAALPEKYSVLALLSSTPGLISANDGHGEGEGADGEPLFGVELEPHYEIIGSEGKLADLMSGLNFFGKSKTLSVPFAGAFKQLGGVAGRVSIMTGDSKSLFKVTYTGGSDIQLDEQAKFFVTLPAGNYTFKLWRGAELIHTWPEAVVTGQGTVTLPTFAVVPPTPPPPRQEFLRVEGYPVALMAAGLPATEFNGRYSCITASTVPKRSSTPINGKQTLDLNQIPDDLRVDLAAAAAKGRAFIMLDWEATATVNDAGRAWPEFDIELKLKKKDGTDLVSWRQQAGWAVTAVGVSGDRVDANYVMPGGSEFLKNINDLTLEVTYSGQLSFYCNATPLIDAVQWAQVRSSPIIVFDRK